MAGKSTINITFKLDGDSKGFKDLAKDADGLKVVMTSAITEAEKLKTSIVNWSQSVQALNSVSNAMGQLNNSLQTLTADSNAFGKAMAAANTMAGKGGEDFDKLKKSVADLAKEVPVARDELANGLYQVISNGVPEDNWLTFLEASAKSSVGGIADLGNAVTVTSTLIKNYGLAWEDAADIQDKIQLTAKNGVTSFEQLAGALPSVAGSASQLGVSIDELMAIFATCTGVTGNTAEVSTQLNAVLKALISPTTQAAKAAEQLGIQFDAAAVKEAGGLDNFLKSVDTAINEYSAKTGELSETIYGNLFGSSRALRLLTSLTGQQSEEFTKNIGVMVDSAGTMDEAYETMSNTASAHTQVLKNLIGSYTDLLTPVTNAIQPFASMAMQVGQMTLGLTTLVKSMNVAKAGMLALGTNVKSLMAGIALLTTAEGKASIATNGFSAAAKAAAISTNGLKLALKGLMISTGVGAALAVVVTVLEKIITSGNKAKDTLGELSSEEQAFQDAVNNAQGEINNEISKLDALMKAHADTSKAVSELNQKYGTIFGTYQTAAEWKDTLIKKSKAYVTQLGFEAKAMELGRQLAEAQTAAYEAQQKVENYEGKKTYTMGRKEYTTHDYSQLQLAAEKAKKPVAELEQKLDDVNKAAAKALAEEEKTSKGSPTPTTEVNTSTNTEKSTKATTANTTAVKANESEYKKLGNAMAEVKENMIGKSGDELKALQEQYQSLRLQREEMEKTMALAEKPLNLTSLQDYDAELAYYNKMRSMATKEELAEWDEKIAATEKAKKAFEEADFTPKALEDIKTYQDVEEELEKLDKAIESTFGDARIALMAHRQEVENLGKAYTQEMSDIEVSLLGPLDTYDKIEKAIQALDEKSKTASKSELKSLADRKKALEDLRDSYDAMGRLSSYQSEMQGIMSGTKAQITIEAKNIGFDKIQENLRDLYAMLDDDSLSDDVKGQITDLIAQYDKLASKSVDTFDTMHQGWNSITGISNSISGISDALKDNGTAWEKVIAVVNGFFSLYEGFNQVMGIIKQLTELSQAHAVAKQFEGEQAQLEASQEMAASAEVASAAAVEQSASQAETTANIEESASEVFKAHAKIPFVGIALAAGFIATMLATMSSLKFAKGGIAYGPTLGMFGEYPGASNNPEVVAPLDRLRSMLKTDDDSVGRVRFQIEGRTLVGILDKENRHSSRT